MAEENATLGSGSLPEDSEPGRLLSRATAGEEPRLGRAGGGGGPGTGTLPAFGGRRRDVSEVGTGRGRPGSGDDEGGDVGSGRGGIPGQRRVSGVSEERGPAQGRSEFVPWEVRGEGSY